MNVDIEKALKLFIGGLREFISKELSKEYGDSWERKYFNSLNDGKQQDIWMFWRSEVVDYKELIDYPNLASFASNSGFFKGYTRNGGRYAVKFSEISDCRNIVAHYITLDPNKVNLAFEHMISIAVDLKLDALERKLTELRNINVAQPKSEPIHATRIVTNLNTISYNSVEHSATRFFVSEKIYQRLISSPSAEYILKVTPNKGKHPKGIYKVPNQSIVNFIEGKRGAYNWQKNKTFHQDGIPRDLVNYFNYD